MDKTAEGRLPTSVEFGKQLGSRLRAYRMKHNYSQEALAKELQYEDKSSISRWENNNALPDIEVLVRLCKLYQCKLDDLVGNFEIDEKPRDEWLAYVRRTPPSNALTDGSRLEIEHGIAILRAIIEGKTLEELCELPGIPKYHRERNDIFALLRTALVSGEIMITKIPFAKSLEEQLKEKYPQLRGAVHVVDLSRTSISEALPPELVAWAAAHHVIPLLRQPLRVGFGFGYTLHRMCRLAPPSVSQFRGTHWIPLMAYAGDEDSVATSANHHAALMEQRHYYSEAIHLPYIPPEKHASHEGLEKIRRHWEQLDIALLSAYGWNKSTKPRVALSYRQIYGQLEKTGQSKTIVGEFLGYILDKDGNVIDEDATDKATIRIPLEDIQRCAQQNKVYFVGYGIGKAPVVRVILDKGYINGLVTDSGIAEELLHD